MMFRPFCLLLLTTVPFTALADTKAKTSEKNAPWAKNPRTQQFNPVYTQQWRKAENRKTCALLVLPRDASAHLPQAKSRSASFSGGWAVAYDIPGKRSAYGIAGTGANISNTDIQRWENHRFWRDGSGIGWGLEGDTGPGYLAYVKVKGQKCLYNVWSSVSEEHLLSLIQDLRQVRP